MWAKIYIDQNAAVLAGKNEYGIMDVEFDPSELDAGQREELVESCCGPGPDHAYKINFECPPWLKTPAVFEATTETLKMLLGARSASRKESERKDKEAVERREREKKDRQERDIRDYLSNPNDRHIKYNQLSPVGERFQPRPEYTDLREHPNYHEIATKAAEIKALASLRNEQDVRDKRMSDLKKMRLEAEMLRIENEKAEQIAEWVSEHGSESQKERLLAGVLPDTEIVREIESAAFAPLMDRDKFDYADAFGDVCKCGYGCDYKLEEDEWKGPLTDGQWETLKEIRRLMPAATVTTLMNVAKSECGSKKKRKSFLVVVRSGAFVSLREYAA